MNNPLNVLIVEDEPLIINSLKSVLEHVSNVGPDFKIKTAGNCDAALLEIDKAVRSIPFDLVIMDINLQPSTDRKFLSGEDLGMELKSLFPKVKMLVVTSHTENYRLNNILQTLNPDGLLVKSDADFKDFIEAVKCILNDIPYYSKIVLKLIRSHVSHDFYLDRKDRLLLYQLSQGTKNKDLPDFIGLSKGGVERRKRNLKEVFCLEHEDDRTLLAAAREKGFI